MKKLLPLALTLTALAVFTGLGIAQQKDQQNKAADKLSTCLMTGEVTQVNVKAKTFTVKEVTFNAAKLKVLPEVGELVLVTYTETRAGPMTTSFAKKPPVTTSFGKKPPVDPCASIRCIAPKVCGLDENNRPACVAPSSQLKIRWCCWFGDCRIGCGNRGYGCSI
jgi:hypothetical protein